MKMIKPISENVNYSAIDIGRLDDLANYSLIHPKLKNIVEGKVFVKEASKATGAEISFQILPPKADLGYSHVHQQNEETYIILKGEGDFQVDDDSFPVSEGSVVRIAPQGKRSLRNSSDTSMVYMVIQSKAGSLEQWTTEDGIRLENRRNWDK